MVGKEVVVEGKLWKRGGADSGGGGKTKEMWWWWLWRRVNNGNVVEVVVELVGGSNVNFTTEAHAPTPRDGQYLTHAPQPYHPRSGSCFVLTKVRAEALL